MYQRAPVSLLLFGTMRRRVVGTMPGGDDEGPGKLGSALSRLVSIRAEDVAETQVGDILRCDVIRAAVGLSRACGLAAAHDPDERLHVFALAVATPGQAHGGGRSTNERA